MSGPDTLIGKTPFPSSVSRLSLSFFQGLEHESQGHNLTLTALHVPYSLDSGL